jgi:hypothetical protein
MTSGPFSAVRLFGLVSTFFVLGSAFFLAGCSAPGSELPNSPPAAPKTAAPAAAPAVLAEATCPNPNVRVQVTEVARSGPQSITVRFKLLNPGRHAPVAIGGAFADAGEPRDAGSLAGIFVVDATGRRKLFVLRDEVGQPQCSTGLDSIPPGGQVEAWARFPVPAPGAVRLTVQVPGLPPFRDLPVADPPRGTAPGGPSY